MSSTLLSRRAILQGAGILLVGVGLPGIPVRATPATGRGRMPPEPDQLASYITVSRDGSVVGWMGKIDLGQGTDIGWIRIIAEELDVPVERVSIVEGDTDRTVNLGGASGSTGIYRGGAVMRCAAAEARRVLVELASQRLGVPSERLVTEDGRVWDASDRRRSLSYGELIGDERFDVHLEWNKVLGSGLAVQGHAVPKAPSDYKIVGKGIVRRRDVAPKVLGTFDYLPDLRLPGMLHGRMIRPTVAGAVPLSVDRTSIADIPGAQVVWEQHLLAVVAPREWDAVRAAERLAVTWSDVSPPFQGNATLYDHIRHAPVVKRDQEETKGDVEAAFADAARIVEAQYEWPFQSHACLSPACGVADVKPDSATVWSATQKPHYGALGVADMLGLPPETVTVISMKGPGSYGRNDAGDAAMDAAVLSRAVGRPVRVQYMRHEGHGWDPKAPASLHVCRAALDREGDVAAWDYAVKAFSKRECFQNEGEAPHTLAGQLLGRKLKPTFIFGCPADSYGFPASRKVSDTIAPLLERASPLRSSHMRYPAGPQTIFATESFVDELAAATHTDPVAFRLRHLTDPRDRAVVAAAAEKMGWRPRDGQDRTAGADGKLKGRGIAFADRDGTRVATIAEIEVDPATGSIRVERYTVAHDCGLIVCPDLLRQTIEGNVIQSTSRALFEEVSFDDRMVTSLDWSGYPIVTMKDVPDTVEIVLIDRPEVESTGAGEASSGPTAAALANAIYDATGVRLRRAPLTPARLKQALRAS